MAAVVTDAGRIETELVVNACGIWAPQVAAMVGAFTPSVPVDHQHVALAAVDGHELPREMPCFRDPDNLVYGKAEAGGILFGGYEPNPVRAGPTACRGITPPHGSTGSRALRAADGRRRAALPFLRDAGVVALICHPDAMTPDGNPLLGPMPGVPGFWMAAGLSLNGFGGAGGLGKTVAERIVDGETELDVTGYRAWRFGAPYRDSALRAGDGLRGLQVLLPAPLPVDVDEGAGRSGSRPSTDGSRSSVRSSGRRTAGSGRTTSSRGAEAERRRGPAGVRVHGPPWFERLREEHGAIRERVGIIDMTSFGKIEVCGPGALPCSSALRQPHRPAGGRVVYTQFLNERGGIVADVTVTRLDDRASGSSPAPARSTPTSAGCG